LLALTVATGGMADGPSSGASRLKAIDADVVAADAAVAAARAKLTDPNQEDLDVDRLRDVAAQRHRAGFTAALQIAKEDPLSDAGFGALAWLLGHAPEVYRAPEGPVALQMMARFHSANPKVGAAVARVAHFAPYGFPNDPTRVEPAYKPAMELFDAVLHHNPDRAARGQAAIGIAWQSLRARGTALAAHNAGESERLRLEAVRLFEGVVKDYGDCPYLDGDKQAPTLGDRAGQELVELRNLQPGQAAPEIAGVDLDGRPFTLSDYRGNVVMLAFWASWCRPCMAEVPHERELVERFKGKPFVIIGVNGDYERATALDTVAKKQIPWRSFWNGADGPWGAISMAWNVRSWPRVYLIDKHGVIRDNGAGGRDFDALLEKLVAEAETGSRR